MSEPMLNSLTVPDVGAPVRCVNCGEGPAEKFYADALGVTHGFFEWRCRRCILETQLAFAREQADRIPVLEKQLDAAS